VWCWCPLLGGCRSGCWVKGKNKIKIPTQNIIYPPLEGGIYNIAKFLQKEKGK
jgi:hypothetical protein